MTFEELAPGIKGLKITDLVVQEVWNNTDVPRETNVPNRRVFANPKDNSLHVKNGEGDTLARGEIGDWLIVNMDGKINIVSADILFAFIGFKNALDLSSGVRAIALQRAESIEKRGFDVEHDKANNNGELVQAAMFVLDSQANESFYPSWWDPKWAIKWANVPYKKRLQIAGDLIAAEIDRVVEEEKLQPLADNIVTEPRDIERAVTTP